MRGKMFSMLLIALVVTGCTNPVVPMEESIERFEAERSKFKKIADTACEELSGRTFKRFESSKAPSAELKDLLNEVGIKGLTYDSSEGSCTLRLTIFNIGGPGDIRAAFYSYNLISPKPYDANTQHPDAFYERKRTGKLKEPVVEFDKPLGNNWYYSMKMD
ncbi:hypothetical protein [Alteromonas antoniana]|uniref:hypothetical protein n=1 Tax=Alteromonas antoniana TaxID=2803813 RepID=UPI001C4510D5|nr:hypothetical protein [Alteromonas antoniana]